MRIVAACLALLFISSAAAQSANERSDPEGDVLEFSQDSGGATSYQQVSGHADVDIINIGHHQESGLLVLGMQVAGSIRDERSGSSDGNGFQAGAFAYQFSLDVRGSDEQDYSVQYVDGDARLEWREDGESRSREVAADKTGGALAISIPTTYLGTIERIEFEAAAIEAAADYDGGSFSSTQYVDVTGPFPG